MIENYSKFDFFDNDIVYLNKYDSTSSLIALTKTEAYENSLLRTQSAKKLLLESSKILYGDTPLSNKLAILQVNTFVFPEPAPAMIRRGPSV